MLMAVALARRQMKQAVRNVIVATASKHRARHHRTMQQIAEPRVRPAHQPHPPCADKQENKWQTSPDHDNRPPGGDWLAYLTKASLTTNDVMAPIMARMPRRLAAARTVFGHWQSRSSCCSILCRCAQSVQLFPDFGFQAAVYGDIELLRLHVIREVRFSGRDAILFVMRIAIAFAVAKVLCEFGLERCVNLSGTGRVPLSAAATRAFLYAV